MRVKSILSVSDRLIYALLALLILGSTMGFGGAVWWFAPCLSIGAFLLMFIKLIQNLPGGQMPILKSPLTLLGLLTLALAVFQLTPLPAPLARRLSSTATKSMLAGACRHWFMQMILMWNCLHLF